MSRRFQFSLRSLLLAAPLCALGTMFAMTISSTPRHAWSERTIVTLFIVVAFIGGCIGAMFDKHAGRVFVFVYLAGSFLAVFVLAVGALVSVLFIGVQE